MSLLLALRVWVYFTDAGPGSSKEKKSEPFAFAFRESSFFGGVILW